MQHMKQRVSVLALWEDALLCESVTIRLELEFFCPLQDLDPLFISAAAVMVFQQASRHFRCSSKVFHVEGL